MKKLLCLLFTISFSHWVAAGSVTYLDVDTGMVIFATDEAKSGTPLACVATEHADKWAMNIETDSAKAIYSLLMTAMASGMTVNIESAGDCADKAGVERPKRVWLQPAASTPDEQPAFQSMSVYKTVGYGMKSNLNCSVQSTLKGPGGQSYMTVHRYSNGNSVCRCQEDSRMVTVASTDYRYATHHQCIIEVSIPVVQ